MIFPGPSNVVTVRLSFFAYRIEVISSSMWVISLQPQEGWYGSPKEPLLPYRCGTLFVSFVGWELPGLGA
jgi:hypothetical protein